MTTLSEWQYSYIFFKHELPEKENDTPANQQRFLKLTTSTDWLSPECVMYHAGWVGALETIRKSTFDLIG